MATSLTRLRQLPEEITVTLTHRRVGLPSPDELAGQLCAGRVAIATGILVAPTTFARSFGADAATAARVTWLTRMMAVRDGAIGLGGLLATRRGGDPTPWLIAGAVSDAVDAVVVAGAVRQGRLRGVLPSVIAPSAAGLAALGVFAAARTRRA